MVLWLLLCQFAALRVALYRLQGAVRLLQGPSSRASAAAMASIAALSRIDKESFKTTLLELILANLPFCLDLHAF